MLNKYSKKYNNLYFICLKYNINSYCIIINIYISHLNNYLKFTQLIILIEKK